MQRKIASGAFDNEAVVYTDPQVRITSLSLYEKGNTTVCTRVHTRGGGIISLRVKGVIRKTNRCTLAVAFPIENSSHRQKCAGPFSSVSPQRESSHQRFRAPFFPEALSILSRFSFSLSFLLFFSLPIGRAHLAPGL